MPWATVFFPCHIIELTNFSTRVELYTGSGTTSRTTALLLRGIRYLRFRPFGPVLRPALLAVGDAGRIQRPANHVVAHARQVLHAAPADQHDGVLLQVMPDPGDISGDLDSVGQAHA